MAIIVSMLRGVNVGTRKVIRMPELTAVSESAGFASLRTYIRCGNVLFGAQEENVAKLSMMIPKAIEKAIGFPVTAILRMA
jgi:uncharacterized protein (DUF1697 family)